MALKPCRECGQQVSTEAVSCPHCGAPLRSTAIPTPEPVPTKRDNGGCVASGFRILGVLWAIVGVISIFNIFKAPDAGVHPTRSGVAFILAFGIYIFPGLILLAIGEFLARRNR
jgi:hypothetical protein